LTLNAVRERHVNTLVYAEGFRQAGGQCPGCAALYTENAGSCMYRGAGVKPVGDLLEIASDYVLQSGGRIEQVKGEAAVKLQAVEGIGAFLRF
jgi:peptide subunit release factor 1 (eRF1)